jgi:hypothetical protein
MHPENHLEKPEAMIDHWSYDGYRLMGTVSKHNRQSDFRSNLQATSPVVEINLEDGYAETHNTFYVLGTPLYISQRE